MKDERIIQLNNKIQSEAFIVVTALLALSVFTKTYILNMGVRDIITEMVIMVASIIYITIRNSMAGYSSTDTSVHGKKLKVIVTLAVAIIIAVTNGVRNYMLYGDKYTGILDGHFIAALGMTFISSLFFTTIILWFVTSVEKIGQKRLEKKLENDDQN